MGIVHYKEVAYPYSLKSQVADVREQKSLAKTALKSYLCTDHTDIRLSLCRKQAPRGVHCQQCVNVHESESTLEKWWRSWQINKGEDGVVHHERMWYKKNPHVAGFVSRVSSSHPVLTFMPWSAWRCEGSPVSARWVESGPSDTGSVHAAGTRGGRRRLKVVGLCGRLSCSNRGNLRGETQREEGVGGGSDFVYPILSELSQQMVELRVWAARTVCPCKWIESTIESRPLMWLFRSQSAGPSQRCPLKLPDVPHVKKLFSQLIRSLMWIHR